MKKKSFYVGASLLVPVLVLPNVAYAQENSDKIDKISDLVIVTGRRALRLENAQTEVKSDVAEKFLNNDLAEILKHETGISLQTNSRNEKTVYLRGLDPRQVPLFVDGIPQYVPYDGYVDFGRFTTFDIEKIQIFKSISPTSLGSNNLGGAINVVTKAPTKPFEASFYANIAGENTDAESIRFGGKNNSLYYQLSYSQSKSDAFKLSNDFNLVKSQQDLTRDNSDYKDIKYAIKFGYSPNPDVEIVAAYSNQMGEKGQPPSIDESSARYWRWPHWDVATTSLNTKFRIGDYETFILKVFENNFGNEVNSFTDGTYKILKTSGKGSLTTGKSIYEDKVNGIEGQLYSNRIPNDEMRFLANLKEDRHREFDANGLMNASYRDLTIGTSVENKYKLLSSLNFVQTISYSKLIPNEVFNFGNQYNLPEEARKLNGQLGLYFNNKFGDFSVVYAQRSRLPTLKDRYSSRLGSYVENPSLRPESSQNYELNIRKSFARSATISVSAFNIEVDDKIQSAFLNAGATSCSATTKCQMQNVGKISQKGVEISAIVDISDKLIVDANYSSISFENKSSPTTKITDIPNYTTNLHINYRPIQNLSVDLLMQKTSSRWINNTAKLAAFVVYDADISYAISNRATIEIGIKNIFDKNYYTSYGFPAPGKSIYTSLKLTY